MAWPIMMGSEFKHNIMANLEEWIDTVGNMP